MSWKEGTKHLATHFYPDTKCPARSRYEITRLRNVLHPFYLCIYNYNIHVERQSILLVSWNTWEIVITHYISLVWFMMFNATFNNISVISWRLAVSFISSPGHRPCELLSWLGIRRHRRPSISFSHLNLLLWNHWTDLNQTCQKYSLDGPLSDLCIWNWYEIQHGYQGP